MPQRCLEKSRGPHIAGIFAIRRVPTVSMLYLFLTVYDVYMCLCSTHTHAIQMLPFQVFQLFMIYRRDVEVTLPPSTTEYQPVGHQRCWTNSCLARPWRHWPRFHVRVRLGGWGIGHFTTCPSHGRPVRLGGREFSCQKLKVFNVEASLNKINQSVRETYPGVVCGYQMVR